MYIAGVYSVDETPQLIDNDIRIEEVRKLLTSFPKQSYTRVYGNKMDIIADSTILYRTSLKTPEGFYPDIFIDNTLLLVNYPEANVLINCPWAEQNYSFIVNGLYKGELLGKEEDARQDENFEKLIGMSSDQGMKFYQLKGFKPNKVYMIPIFSGFPNISKQDKVSIEVYSTNDPRTVLVDMIIFKKKFNRDVEMIFKILDI